MGMIEEVTESVKGRLVMQTNTSSDFVQRSADALLDAKVPTPIYTYLSKYPTQKAIIDFMFTDEITWSLCQRVTDITIQRVINMEIMRSDRTILEVNIAGNVYALKCVKQNAKTAISEARINHVRTPTQDEASAYDRLPEKTKDLFVKKFAHGRLWIYLKVNDVKPAEEYDTEIILMEKMGKAIYRDG